MTAPDPDDELRLAVYRHFAATGSAPGLDELARVTGIAAAEA